jgi:hypothetical protein
MYTAPRYGSFNSTQVLFLTSTLGANNFIQNQDGGLSDKNIFMKINNSIRSDLPVVYSGGDEKRIMYAIELDGVIEFTITDANLVPLDLLDELYITLRIRPKPYLRSTPNPTIRTLELENVESTTTEEQE